MNDTHLPFLPVSQMRMPEYSDYNPDFLGLKSLSTIDLLHDFGQAI